MPTDEASERLRGELRGEVFVVAHAGEDDVAMLAFEFGSLRTVPDHHELLRRDA